MLGVTEKALAAGMNVIRYNQRNCGGTDSPRSGALSLGSVQRCRGGGARGHLSATALRGLRWLDFPWAATSC